MFADSRFSMDRRSFLKWTAAAVAGATVVGRAGSLLAAEDDIYGGLKVGIQSYSLRDRALDKCLDAMKNDLKLHYIECYPNHLAARSPKQIKELMEAAGVNFTSYGVVPFKKEEKQQRQMFEIAKTYGLKTLSADPDDNKETFDLLEKLTEEYGVSIAIHPHGPGHKWGKSTQLAKAFEGRSTRIGLCADTGHIIRSGEDPLKVIQQFGDRTHSLHLKDFKKLDGNKWEDVPAGTANLDVDAMIKHLITSKFAGHIYVEYEGKDPVASIQKSTARVAEAVKKAK